MNFESNRNRSNHQPISEQIRDSYRDLPGQYQISIMIPMPCYRLSSPSVQPRHLQSPAPMTPQAATKTHHHNQPPLRRNSPTPPHIPSLLVSPRLEPRSLITTSALLLCRRGAAGRTTRLPMYLPRRVRSYPSERGSFSVCKPYWSFPDLRQIPIDSTPPWLPPPPLSQRFTRSPVCLSTLPDPLPPRLPPRSIAVYTVCAEGANRREHC